MVDNVDNAELIEQRMRARGVARIRTALDAEGSAECETCSDEIPEERRKAIPSATRCATCQEIFERRGRR